MALAGLALATVAFVGSHLLMSHPLRVRLVQSLGEARFSLFYSLISAATLGWMSLTFRAVDSSLPLWIAPDWWWPVASILMLFASILLVGSFAKNPTFPHPGAPPKTIRPVTGVFAITRHPMNWSFAIWALVHISVWGGPRNLIVAVGILLLALLGSAGQDRKKAALLGQTWRDWQARTSFMPFGAVLAGKVPVNVAAPGWVALGGGFLLWLVVTSLHAPNASLAGWLGLI